MSLTYSESPNGQPLQPPQSLQGLGRLREITGQGLEPVIDALAATPKGVLLVAGGKIGLWPPHWRHSPRLLFWPSTEASTTRHAVKRVPDRVVAIVFNKFVDHGTTNRLREESKRLSIPMYPTPLTPHQISDLIIGARLVSGPAPEEEVEEEASRVPRGALREFIRDHASFNVAGPAEIDRLFTDAINHNLRTTRGSVAQAFYELRKQALPQESSTPEEPPVVDTPEPGEPPLTHVPDPVAPVTALAEAVSSGTLFQPVMAVAGRDIANVVALIDDAVTGLQLVREAILQIEPRLAESQALAAKLASIRAVLG
jgi:hypothetical protein